MAGPAAAAGAPAGLSPLPVFAASTSRAMTRPCGPEPEMRLTSMSASFASRRASGEANTRFAPAALSALVADGAALGWGRGAGFGFAAGACAGGAAGALAGAAGFAPAAAPAPAAAAFTSSPSAASTAISWFTGTSAVPSGTTILASVPSSIASYSMVALSVSISAMTSPDFTLSPSRLSHLERLPFSMVGDSAGIKMLIGMGVRRGAPDLGSGRWLLGRVIHLVLERGTDAGEHVRDAALGLAGVDTRQLEGDVGQHLAPHLGVLEHRPHGDMQALVDHAAAQDFDAAMLQRRVRDLQRLERRWRVWVQGRTHDILTGNKPPSRPRRFRPPKAMRVFRDWPRRASARPCR